MANQSIILPYKGMNPQIAEDAFVAPSVAITGDTHIGEGTNIWFQCTVRGDVNHIRIGKFTNIQDNSVCHVTTKKFPLHIGSYVTVGHHAVLHGCTIEDHAFVGMSATVMDGAVVESGAMVAAGSLVTPGKVVKSGELWAGSPAKFMRNVTQEEKDYISWSSQHYYELGQSYKNDQ